MTKNRITFFVAMLFVTSLFSCKKDPQKLDPRLVFVGDYSVVDSCEFIYYPDQTQNQDTVFHDTITLELYGENQFRIVNAKVFNEQIITVDGSGVVWNCQGNYILGTLTNSTIDIKTTDNSYGCEGHGPMGWDDISKKSGFKL
jgi:hypothetical protein